MLKIWIDEYIQETFLSRFENKTKGTVFEGAELIPNGNREIEYGQIKIEYELKADKLTHLEIPGYKFLGMAQFENGQTLFNSFAKDLDLSSVPNITSNRCDVCKVRHNRVKVFILKDIFNDNITVVGGSCSKKFKEIDLEKLVLGIFSGFDKFIADFYNDEEIVKVKRSRDLAREIAIGEYLINKDGYTSKSNAEVSGRFCTASNIELIASNPYPNPKSSITKEDWQGIYNRTKELTESSFQEQVGYIQKQIENKASDFFFNCLAILKGNITSKSGYTAYLANISFLNKQEKLENGNKTKGLSVPLDKMMDLGKFTVLTRKWNQSFYGNYYGVTAINQNNEKVWFKMLVTAKSCESIAVDDIIGKEIAIRGKVSENKPEISFIKNVKIVS